MQLTANIEFTSNHKMNSTISCLSDSSTEVVNITIEVNECKVSVNLQKAICVSYACSSLPNAYLLTPLPSYINLCISKRCYALYSKMRPLGVASILLLRDGVSETSALQHWILSLQKLHL